VPAAGGYDGIRIGELIVGLRTGQRRLGGPDIEVLDLLAGPLALALHATAPDDHPVVREGLSALLASVPSITSPG
jgi:hypothetical protein